MADSDEVTQPEIFFPQRSERPPGLIIYWSDTGKPLSFQERVELSCNGAEVVAVTPGEVLIRFCGHHVVVRAAGSPGSPPVPKRRSTDWRDQ